MSSAYGGAGNDSRDGYGYNYPVHQGGYDQQYLSDCPGEESSFWSSSPRSDSPSPGGAIQSPAVGPYQIYTPLQYPQEHRQQSYRNPVNLTGCSMSPEVGPPYVRVVKRRSTANKKERRRTQSINNAYADLRDCIPNVPADTKLSKTDEPAGGFRAELGSMSRKSGGSGGSGSPTQQKSDPSEELCMSRRAKGRTGWPQHVWALELKQEHPNGM